MCNSLFYSIILFCVHVALPGTQPNYMVEKTSGTNQIVRPTISNRKKNMLLILIFVIYLVVLLLLFVDSVRLRRNRRQSLLHVLTGCFLSGSS